MCSCGRSVGDQQRAACLHVGDDKLARRAAKARIFNVERELPSGVGGRISKERARTQCAWPWRAARLRAARLRASAPPTEGLCEQCRSPGRSGSYRQTWPCRDALPRMRDAEADAQQVAKSINRARTVMGSGNLEHALKEGLHPRSAEGAHGGTGAEHRHLALQVRKRRIGSEAIFEPSGA